MYGANTIGVFRQSAGYLSAWVVNSSGSHTYAGSDAVYYFGLNGDQPIMGDRTGTGHLQMGIYRLPVSATAHGFI